MVVALAVLAYLSVPPDPVHQGRRLSEWLPGVGFSSVHQKFVEGEEDFALKAIGTNAVPFLVNELERRDTSVWRAFVHFLDRLGWNRFEFVTSRERHVRALVACRVLGRDSVGALPAIMELLATSQDFGLWMNAIPVIDSLRPLGEPSPELIEVMPIAPDPVLKEEIIRIVLPQLPRSSSSVPALITVLQLSGNEGTRIEAAWALREIGPAASNAIPELTKARDNGTAVLRSGGLIFLDSAQAALLSIAGDTNLEGRLPQVSLNSRAATPSLPRPVGDRSP